MKKQDISLEEILQRESGNDDPVCIYTFWLLAYLWSNGICYKVFLPNESLPVPTNWEPEDVPPFHRIRNRLKILSELDPVIYTEPKKRLIELNIDGTNVNCHIEFHDLEPLERFEVTIEEIGESGIDFTIT